MPVKGYKKKNGKSARMIFRFAEVDMKVMQAYADIYCDGNVTAYITARATSDSQEGFKKRLREWELDKRETQKRRFARAGLLPPTLNPGVSRVSQRQSRR